MGKVPLGAIQGTKTGNTARKSKSGFVPEVVNNLRSSRVESFVAITWLGCFGTLVF